MLRIRHCGTALGASLCVQAHSLSYMSVAKSTGRRHRALQAECFFVLLVVFLAFGVLAFVDVVVQRDDVNMDIAVCVGQ